MSTTAPQLIERLNGVTELGMLNKPSVASFEVGAERSLDAAFSGTTALFRVPNGGYFRSKTLRRNKINRTDENSRGWSRASVNFDDFASATVPGSGVLTFLRVKEVDNAGVAGSEGPILVVPPVGFFASSRRVLVLSGTSPNVASLPSGLPPAGCMEIVFPRFCDRLEFVNSGATNILLSFDQLSPEFTVLNGSTEVFEQAGIKRMFIHCSGATSAFSIKASVVGGISH
jgi:hypothetical protein